MGLNAVHSNYVLVLNNMYILTVVLYVAISKIFSPVYLLMLRECRKNEKVVWNSTDLLVAHYCSS